MLLIEAAINGPADVQHPAVSVNPEERTAAESVRAGASAIHFHLRSESGKESLEPGDLDIAPRQIRSAVPKVSVGVSTGAWIERDPAVRLAKVVSGGWGLTLLLQTLAKRALVNLQRLCCPAVLALRWGFRMLSRQNPLSLLVGAKLSEDPHRTTWPRPSILRGQPHTRYWPC